MRIHDFFAKFEGESLTFDDLILHPDYTDVPQSAIDLSTPLTKNLTLTLPIISSPMDTVTEGKLAAAMAEKGGIGLIHFNMPVEKQLEEILLAREMGANLVGAACETWAEGAARRLAKLAGHVDAIVFDTAHGHTQFQLSLIRWVKEHYPSLQVIGGNVVTAKGAEALVEAGADALRVGMGIGGICTTQMVSGIGRGQASAIYECARVAREANVPVIADGGIRKTGDMVKAFCLGASTVMLGSMMASTEESAGAMMEIDGVPVKQYRGMGSLSAMEQGSFSRYGLSNSGPRVPEGVVGQVPCRGSASSVLDEIRQGILQGLHRTGICSIPGLHEKLHSNNVHVERRSESARREGGLHGLLPSKKQSEVACSV